jgi:hypothetical protein
MRFSVGLRGWHGLCPTYLAQLIHSRRIAMKFETLMLHSLFAACLLVCVSTLSAMLV